jgi:hypothetical protein
VWFRLLGAGTLAALHGGMRPSLIVLLLLLPLTAQAERQWYGWQILAADAASWMLAGGISPVFALGVAGSGAAVHLAHGQGGRRAAASVALRAGGLVAGGVIGAAIASGHRCDAEPDVLINLCPLVGMMPVVLGAVGGLAAAQIIDALVLGWKERPTGPGVAPGLVIEPRAFQVRLSGRF